MGDNTLYILILVGLGIVVILVMSVLLIFNTSKRRILSEISDKQQKELEFQQQMLKNSIETQEKERSRIAQELHDDIGSKLNVLNLSINLLETAANNGNNFDTPLDQIRTTLNDSIVRLRELSHVLFPPVLKKFGIKSALSSLSIAINKTGQIKLEMDIDHDWGNMELSQELNIYRIVQELINNTLKHAKAQNIKIISDRKGEGIELMYWDDGIGFPNEEDIKVGMGMSNIKTRVALLNGEISMKNNVPKGIEVKLLIPQFINEKNE